MTVDSTGDDHRGRTEGHSARLQLLRNDLSGQAHGGVVQAHTVRDVHISVPDSSPGQPPVPRQLPAAPHRFVNRTQELDLLTRLAVRRFEDNRPMVAVVSGMTGVGKSAVAIAWANDNVGRFYGGQLYADMADHRHRGGVDVSDVVRGFLRDLGVDDAYIPADLPERTSMFRSLTAAAPVLVVLDDVDQPAQVRPLLPGSARSAVIVTSRKRLGGLLVDGAELVEMRPLGIDEGSSLVAQMLPDNRVAAERDALRELAGLCAGLPIALRIAGARIAARRNWPVDRLVRYLADEDERLKRLSVTDERKVETVFDAAYADLPDAAQRIYRNVGIHPGPDFSSSAIAAGSDTPVEATDEALSMLCEANLMEEYSPDRYRVHELVRLHARQRAEHELSSRARRRVLRRFADWYLLGASAADHLVLGPERWRLAAPDLTRWRTSFDAGSAMSWFETERANLLSVVRAASRARWYELVWQLCEALWALYHSRKHYADWIEAHRLGVDAAVVTRNRVAETRMRNQLARAHLELRDYDRAADELHDALAAANASGDQRALATVLESFGLLEGRRERYEEAIAHFRRAQQINEQIGDRRGVALQLYQLGDVLVRSGRADETPIVLVEALRIFENLDDVMAGARVRIALGRAYRALDRTPEARTQLLAAVVTCRDRGQSVKEAQALEELVGVADDQGDTELFDRSARRLLQLYVDSRSPRGAMVRGWLEQGGLGNR